MYILNACHLATCLAMRLQLPDAPEVTCAHGSPLGQPAGQGRIIKGSEKVLKGQQKAGRVGHRWVLGQELLGDAHLLLCSQGNFSRDPPRGLLELKPMCKDILKEIQVRTTLKI